VDRKLEEKKIIWQQALSELNKILIQHDVINFDLLVPFSGI
jgi:hypothetical protein